MTDEEEEAKAIQDAAGEALVSVVRAMDAQPGDIQLVPAVYVPPGLRIALADNRTQREIMGELLDAGWTPPTFEDEKLRIQQQLDPVGMAIAIAQGMALPVYQPQADRSVKVSYVQVKLSERIKVMNKLLDRVMPAPTGAQKKPKENDDGKTDPHAFLAMVQRAGEIAQHALANARIVNADAAVVEADASDEEEDAIRGA